MKYQRGSTLIGFVAGVVVGLLIALVVAMVITRTPVPFLHESPSRTADQDANELRKNKDWDPNAPLYGKNPARPASVASAPAADAAPAAAASAAPASVASAPKRGASAAAPAPAAKSSDPLGDLVKQKAGADPFVYFVQVGAFNSAQDAEAQRAKLALFNLDAKISERDQSGRTVYRVRSGPFDSKDEAEKTKERIEAAAFEATVVRIQR